RQAGTATVPNAVVEEARRNITRPTGGTTTAALVSDSAVTPHGLSGPPSGAARLLQFQTGTHEIHLEVRDTAATRTLPVSRHRPPPRQHPPPPTPPDPSHPDTPPPPHSPPPAPPSPHPTSHQASPACAYTPPTAPPSPPTGSPSNHPGPVPRTYTRHPPPLG